MKASLTRYRVMAYVTGVMLLVLVFAAMPLKYGWYGVQSGTLMSFVGFGHGLLYMVYLVAAFDLAVRAKWSFPRTLLLLVAGTLPFLSFVVERKATQWVAPAAVPSQATV